MPIISWKLTQGENTNLTNIKDNLVNFIYWIDMDDANEWNAAGKTLKGTLFDNYK